ncbi:PAS domain-containing sensor histidine kinase [Brevibacillus daliensis]|uniref:PAS domain-containing sensor histidine kinase n=1 Tax=Brevibacillus daliensis TaxID=2892995 RepID=UPI001E3FC502|nr:PAS domain-containing sensor histidine kinase [Brevibacillus daliensis]
MIQKQYCFTFSRLKQYLKQIRHAICIINKDGRIMEGNDVFLQVTGFTYKKLIGQPFQFVIPTYRTIQQLYSDLYDQANNNQDTPDEIFYLDTMGHRRKTNVMVSQHDSETGPVFLIHFFDLIKDSALSLSQRMAQQLTSQINLGVVVLDLQANLVDISDKACEILGMESQDILNHHVNEIFDGISEEHRLIQPELLEGIKFQNRAMSWTNSKQRYDLLVDSNTLLNEQGKIVGAYVMFKDVTNMRSFEQKIERSDRLAMIGQIAAGTAHEIRNPLTSIKGFLQMFQQSFIEKGMERERTYTEIMLTEINRINSLVSEFLLLSKPRETQYQLVELDTLFEEIMPIVKGEALLHGIDVNQQLTTHLPIVVGDTELLKQVFLNICKNGIEAMGDEGALTITYNYEGNNKICINIQDNGPGIPGYIMDKIFDPFFTTKDDGTGLGLSVCQKIIHDIGGQIRVSSKGYGSTFHIILSHI